MAGCCLFTFAAHRAVIVAIVQHSCHEWLSVIVTLISTNCKCMCLLVRDEGL